MKTQILQLEAHDDAISTRDKMGWGQTSRIVLVWPKRGRILNRKLDLVLLQRHSIRMGAQVALVTRDTEVRFYASQLHIPVFKTLKQAKSTHWRTMRRWRSLPQRQTPRPDFQALREEVHPSRPSWAERPVARAGFFSIAILSLLALLAATLPGARISIAPHTQIQESSLHVAASPAYQHINLSGELPVQMKSIVVEGRDVLTSTGRVMVPENTASGYVRLTNLISDTVEVPRGFIITTLSSNGKAPLRFATSSDGRVPAGPGKYLSLPVRALSPGTQGNLPAGSLSAIEGPLGLSLASSNLLPTSGGTDRAASGPSSSDYRKLEEKLSRTLLGTALTELSAGLSNSDLVITPTLVLSDTLEKSFDPPFDSSLGIQPADELKLTLRAQFQLMVVSGADLRDLSNRVLDANLEKGYNAITGSLQIDQLSVPRLGDANTARWQIHIRRKVQLQVDAARVTNLVMGMPPEQARLALSKALPLDGDPILELIPSWWPRLPIMPFRIRIELNNR